MLLVDILCELGIQIAIQVKCSLRVIVKKEKQQKEKTKEKKTCTGARGLHLITVLFLLDDYN